MKSISIRNLSFTYPRATHRALSAINLSVATGELLCLVGPSGCGKTTLLKLVSGLLHPDEGEILFDGEDVTAVPPERRKAVMVFQSHMLFPYMTVADNVAFALRMQGVETSVRLQRATEMLERVHLSGFENRRPASLSAGQRQRVALARALVADPSVLLLDEPLSNLDRHLREEMRQAILELQRDTGVTTVCVTHDQEEAVLLGDRIAMFSSGELAQAGVARDFYERPASVAVATFFGNTNHLEGVLSGGSVSSSLGTFAVKGDDESAWPADGTVCIHVRPESIEIQPPCPYRENCISAKVMRRVYVGTHVRYSVEVAGRPWQVVATPVATQFDEGAEVSLYLPADRLWLTKD